MTKQRISQTLDQYRIVSRLGEGSLSTVYEARDTKRQENVAVQVIHPLLAALVDWPGRAQQVVQLAARLEHPGLVAVRDFGQANSLAYLVTDLIPGKPLHQTLHDLKQQGRWLKLPDVLKLTRQLSLTVDYLHQQGIFHRDLRPNNIMFKTVPGAGGLPYQTVLTDVGLMPLGLQEHPAELAWLGQLDDFPERLAYLSPEYLVGRPTDARSDVYSLGALLYTLATGRLPPAAAGVEAAIQAHQTGAPAAPRSLKPDLPEAVETVIMRALAKNPEQRFPRAADLAEGLAALIELDSVTAGSGAIRRSGPATVLAAAPETGPGVPAAGLPAGPPQGRIWLRGPQGPLQPVPVPAAGLTVGRSSENDVQLEASKISRRHLQIDFDGATYFVTDLGSTNGTYLVDHKLEPHQPTIWTPEQVIFLGPYQLQLTPESPSLAQAGPAAAQVGLEVQPPQLSVIPGERARLLITVSNNGPAPDRISLSVEGVPVEWLDSLPSPLHLPAGAAKKITLVVEPPRTPEIRAGRHRLTLRATSEDEPQVTAQEIRTLTIGSYSQFESELWPERIAVGQWAKVTIKNQGNTPETFSLRYQDQTDELNFGAAPDRLNVAPGQSDAAEFRLTARRRRWFGREERSYPFSVQVVPGDAEAQTLHAEATGRGLIPVWVVPAVTLLLCLLGSGVGASWWGQWGPFAPETVAQATETSTITPTATPDLTATAALQALAAVTGQAGTAAVQTGTAVAVERAATAEAGTATTQAQQTATTQVQASITALAQTQGTATAQAQASGTAAAQTATAAASATPATGTPTPTSVPVAPTDLTAAAKSATEIDLKWADNSNNETRFEIERSLSGGAFSLLQTVAPETESYLDTGLSSNTQYCYRVRAVNAAGNSAYTPEKCTTTSPVLPVAPTNLTVTPSISELRIDLQWIDKSDNETGFKIWRSVGDGGFTAHDVVEAGKQSYSDKAVMAKTEYCYQVQAVNSAGGSAFSNSRCATLTSPTAPTNLTATALNSETAFWIDLQWQDNSNNETGFEIERRPNKSGGDNYGLLTTVIAGMQTYRDEGLNSKTNYCYRVRAVNAAGQSGYTPEKCQITLAQPAAPTNLTATALNSETAFWIDLQWQDKSNNETGFEIFRYADSIVKVSAGVTTYKDNGPLNPGTQYCYQVRAINAAGGSALTQPASCATTLAPPAVPMNLMTTMTSTNQITLTWTAPAGTVTKYQVFRGSESNKIAEPTATIHTDSSLNPNTEYCYWIRAANAAGSSASVKTNPCPKTMP